MLVIDERRRKGVENNESGGGNDRQGGFVQRSVAQANTRGLY